MLDNITKECIMKGACSCFKKTTGGTKSMNVNTVSKHEWSATKLGFVASIFACTASAILALIAIDNLSFPSITWTTLDKLFIVFFSYSQLLVSTLHHSPVSRNGNVIEGMIYSDLGDDDVRTTVSQWVLQWFVSVLCHSIVFSVMGILMISALKSDHLIN